LFLRWCIIGADGYNAPAGSVLWTTDEVAAALKCSRGTVYRHVRTGALPARRVGEAGPLRFEPAAVERLLRPALDEQEHTR
jgi:excisionase family DNA binding protein